MSNIEKTSVKLNKGEEVCYADDFYNAAIRIVPTGQGNAKVYLKFRHREETLVKSSNETAMQIELGGKEIAKSVYMKF